MGKTINFGIVGYGKMGKIRYETLSEMDGCCVKSIYEAAEGVEFPEDVTIARFPDDIFTNPDIDAVVISTPNHFIKEYVVKSLEQGKHVFAEKPPGRDLEEVCAMREALNKAKDSKLMFGFNHRHHESMIKAKSLIDSGEYGKVLWMRGRYGKSVDDTFFGNWRSKKDLAGGGIFLDQGIHMLDLFLMFCKDFDEVKALVSNLYWHLDIEDNVFAIFHNKEGQVASLHSTMTQWRHIFSLEIFLEHGYMTINGLKTSSNSYGDEILTVAKNRSLPPAASWTDEEKHAYHVDTSWKTELEIFVDAVANNKDISVGSIDDAVKLMTLVEKVYAQQ
ncbi:MAG: Gfo/Idh/MocA family oxidoreductase [Candidatus Omnitrophica bacterium]|nr:Gfo/Idh/MocA family oxidoreductase [Candidatus Omnitrophota bacterium]